LPGIGQKMTEMVPQLMDLLDEGREEYADEQRENLNELGRLLTRFIHLRDAFLTHDKSRRAHQQLRQLAHASPDEADRLLHLLGVAKASLW
jgi:hypothetical protein